MGIRSTGSPYNINDVSSSNGERGKKAPRVAGPSARGARNLTPHLFTANLTTRMWKEYISAVLGLCVAAVAFLGLTGTTLTWTLVVLGATILIASLWEASVVASTDLKKSHA